MRAAHSTDALAALIERKLGLMRQIHALTKGQQDLVASERIDLLLQVFRAKGALLGEIHQIERQIDPYRDEAPEARVWRSEADRLRCRQQAAECQSLLAEIQAWERQCEGRLAQERDQTARQLGELQKAGEARVAYAAPRSAAPSQVDLSM